ncbi:hypothetical protein FACS1894187_09650 [Synergistales bacterium]|nr:hypothetical protein FACS1894187_09650 [Synergistales bacterium]
MLLLGTSMGGARPKAVVSDKDNLWLAKFNSDKDRWNNAIVEHAMLNLAQECGLNVAQSKIKRVGGKDVLLVKRFDREHTKDGYLRHRMFSALTALRTDDSPTSRSNWSYITLVEELRRFSTTPHEDARQLFMRMVFNALISNTDDHPRNHAFIAHTANDWRLSPAYDLTPTPMTSIEHRESAMVCGNRGRWANAKNMRSECRRFMLEPTEAESIIKTMAEFIEKGWYKTVRRVGVSERDCEAIKSAFVYQGFFME